MLLNKEMLPQRGGAIASRHCSEECDKTGQYCDPICPASMLFGAGFLQPADRNVPSRSRLRSCRLTMMMRQLVALLFMITISTCKREFSSITTRHERRLLRPWPAHDGHQRQLKKDSSRTGISHALGLSLSAGFMWVKFLIGRR